MKRSKSKLEIQGAVAMKKTLVLVSSSLGTSVGVYGDSGRSQKMMLGM